MKLDSEGRIEPLDGLRAIAILMVMLFHFTRGHGSALLWRITDIGWVGVDLFFVLSGFLITGILLRAKDSPGYLRNFYSRRALRILPLYYATLIFAFILLPLGFRECPAIPFRDQAPFWFYYANFSARIESPCYMVGHFWSLAVEEQFYLLWPLVLMTSRESTARRICVFVMLTAFFSRLVLALAGMRPEATFDWTFARFDGLAAGSLIALCFRSDPLQTRLEKLSTPVMLASGALLAIVIATGGSGLVFDSDHSVATIAARSGLPLLAAILFASLLVASVSKVSLRNALSWRIGTTIARYSYGAYAFHMLLMPGLLHAFPRQRLVAISGSADAAIIVFAVLGAITTFAIAAISYHGFESFFLGLRPRRQEPAAPALAPQVT